MYTKRNKMVSGEVYSRTSEYQVTQSFKMKAVDKIDLHVSLTLPIAPFLSPEEFQDTGVHVYFRLTENCSQWGKAVIKLF